MAVGWMDYQVLESLHRKEGLDIKERAAPEECGI